MRQRSGTGMSRCGTATNVVLDFAVLSLAAAAGIVTASALLDRLAR